MRVVHKPEHLLAGLQEARPEAGASFGNDAVFLERYIRRARHIEVQILADHHGNVLASARTRLLGAAAKSESRGSRAAP